VGLHAAARICILFPYFSRPHGPDKQGEQYANACAEYHDLLESKQYKQANELLEKYIRSQSRDHTLKTDFNMVRTNLCRAFINEKMMNERKPVNCESIEPIDNNDSQIMHLYIGLPLISNFNNDKLKLFNGEHFQIQEINGDSITLTTRMMNRNTRLKEPKVLNKTDIAKNFSPAYAFTSYKAEGQTLDQPYTIWEFDNMHYKTRYTTLTRATNCKNITINTEPFDVLTKVNTGKKARIYLIYDDEQRYIGQTVKTIEERFEEHKICQSNTKLYDLERYLTNLERYLDAPSWGRKHEEAL
jgi:hypothetical protein